MSTSYNEMSAVVRIDNVLKLVQNMKSERGENAAHSLDEFIVNELEEVKRLLDLA